jgi:hypothetical protein
MVHWLHAPATALAILALSGSHAQAGRTGETMAPGPLRPAAVSALMPESRDYSLMWWAYGWRGRSPDGRKVLCVQTGRYGLAIDAEKLQILHLGPIERPAGYEAAAAQDNAVVLGLPAATLNLTVRAGGKEYRCVGCDPAPVDYFANRARIVETGRFVQRMDFADLVFKDAAGERLAADCRLEMIAWPDRLAFALAVPYGFAGSPEVRVSASGNSLATEAGGGPDESGAWGRASAAIDYGDRIEGWSPKARAITGDKPFAPLKVTRDPVGGWTRIELAPQTFSDPKGHLERAEIELTNAGGAETSYRLLFAKDYSFPGITGLVPMLRDAEGNPTGIPVQLSKDWHATPGRPLPHQGPWLHCFSMVRLPAHSTVKLEFDVAYGMWGSVPAASHAQLCLIGYGGNQLWDQSAVGTWGESICYDPDVNLNRSMIDDVRPLMVWAMNSDRQKWSWTNNVGGGDFLVYFDERNERQRLARMRTAYLSHGPNLTHVVYSGITPDGRIAARMDARLARTDDVVRGLHHIRYDVLKPAPFKRLAFYQLGADNYNGPSFSKLARGDAKGMAEEWTFERGGLKYRRAATALTGRSPWISLHDGVNPDSKGGGYATRGLIVRSWRARLGGREVPAPFAAFFGTEDGRVPGMNAEIAPPPGLTELLPGDFVEADIEMVIVPLTAESYYGPNENLRRALEAGANTWKPVLREAACGELDVKAVRGRIAGRQPVVVEADAGGGASVDVSGGVGYAPISFRGLRDYRGYELLETVGGATHAIDQSVQGRDFWQADFDPTTQRWTLTFNVCLDSPGDARRKIRLELRLPNPPAPFPAGEGGD